MDTYELIEALCGQSGIPSREHPVMDAIRAQFKDFPCAVDPLGGLHVQLRAPQRGEKTLLLEAHADRVGLVVTDYLQGGFVRVAKAGGADEAALMGSRIRIQSRDGSWLTGVIGLPFPYPAKPHNSAPASEYKMPQVGELFVDTGLAEPEKQIARGAQCLLEGDVRRLFGTRVSAPALDNRAGCAALILAAQMLADQPLGVGLRLLFASREEVGGAGAKAGAFYAEPDYAVVVDTGFAISPDVDKKDGVEMGAGPEIDCSPLLDEKMYALMLRCAQEQGIPHQPFVLAGRSTGTDADGVAVTGPGVRTALLSVPVRFMHHPAEVCDLTDIESTAALLAAFAKEVR